MTKKEDRRSRRSKAGAAVILAPVYIPALWRVLDHRRPEGEPLNGDGLDLEQIYFDSIDGTRLHMTACGKGKDTLFFVHGWTCNETIFRYQQEHFSDRYRVYTLELRGHGGSEIPESLDYHHERLHGVQVVRALRQRVRRPAQRAGHHRLYRDRPHRRDHIRLRHQAALSVARRQRAAGRGPVSYTHLRAHETRHDL